MKKSCPHCGKIKSFKQFYKDKAKKTGLSSWCKKCSFEKAKDRESTYGEQMRIHHLKQFYGITLEQYDKMVEDQDGVCAICNNINSNGRRLSVDHNHKTGKVRGLLCGGCNAKLGVIENKDFIKKAKQYLKG
jgi:hypothetical protein